MILNSWGLKGSRKSAGGLTTKVLKGQTVASQKRAKGQSNPSDNVIAAQIAAGLLWPYFRVAAAGIRAGWTKKKPTESADNAWYRYNYLAAIEPAGEGTDINPLQLQFTQGSMTPTDFTLTNNTSSQTVTATWDDTPIDDTQLSTDKVVMLATTSVKVLNPQREGLIIQSTGVATRADGTLVLTFPTGTYINGNTLMVWLGFYGDPLAINTGKSSNSVLGFRTAA